MLRWTTLTTPVGPFTLLTHDDRVLASGWTSDVAALRALAPTIDGDAVTRAGGSPAADAVAAYCDGELAAVTAVPVHPAALGPFVGVAWRALRAIPAGEVISYTELARRAGRTGAVRAAASACARNPAALFVPCHRVRRADGALGGFRWGGDVKRWLLDHERAVTAPAGQAVRAANLASS
jgi:methylated-DNA-[protein]-cysteine S-methyltransferase